MSYFKQLRKALGFTQDECATHLEISVDTVRKYEAKIPDYVIARMESLVSHFGVPLDKKKIGGK